MPYAIITDTQSFGQVIRSARKERGWSQRALAQHCGCSQRFVSELERGKSTAELGKALFLLETLGFSLLAQRNQPAEDGRRAVELLSVRVSTKLERGQRNKTSLLDYLEG
ncbi:MAG: helix-turn-helix domain-containing protein [Coriobacteriales bacterium]|nr:helix-turn-helix domain-containing protein [Coriobacteriales bacterium]